MVLVRSTPHPPTPLFAGAAVQPNNDNSIFHTVSNDNGVRRGPSRSAKNAMAIYNPKNNDISLDPKECNDNDNNFNDDIFTVSDSDCPLSKKGLAARKEAYLRRVEGYAKEAKAMVMASAEYINDHVHTPEQKLKMIERAIVKSTREGPLSVPGRFPGKALLTTPPAFSLH